MGLHRNVLLSTLLLPLFMSTVFATSLLQEYNVPYCYYQLPSKSPVQTPLDVLTSLGAGLLSSGIAAILFSLPPGGILLIGGATILYLSLLAKGNICDLYQSPSFIYSLTIASYISNTTAIFMKHPIVTDLLLRSMGLTKQLFEKVYPQNKYPEEVVPEDVLRHQQVLSEYFSVQSLYEHPLYQKLVWYLDNILINRMPYTWIHECVTWKEGNKTITKCVSGYAKDVCTCNFISGIEPASLRNKVKERCWDLYSVEISCGLQSFIPLSYRVLSDRQLYKAVTEAYENLLYLRNKYPGFRFPLTLSWKTGEYCNLFNACGLTVPISGDITLKLEYPHRYVFSVENNQIVPIVTANVLKEKGRLVISKYIKESTFNISLLDMLDKVQEVVPPNTIAYIYVSPEDAFRLFTQAYTKCDSAIRKYKESKDPKVLEDCKEYIYYVFPVYTKDNKIIVTPLLASYVLTVHFEVMATYRLLKAYDDLRTTFYSTITEADKIYDELTQMIGGNSIPLKEMESLKLLIYLYNQNKEGTAKNIYAEISKRYTYIATSEKDLLEKAKEEKELALKIWSTSLQSYLSNKTFKRFVTLVMEDLPTALEHAQQYYNYINSTYSILKDLKRYGKEVITYWLRELKNSGIPYLQQQALILESGVCSSTDDLVSTLKCAEALLNYVKIYLAFKNNNFRTAYITALQNLIHIYDYRYKLASKVCPSITYDEKVQVIEEWVNTSIHTLSLPPSVCSTLNITCDVSTHEKKVLSYIEALDKAHKYLVLSLERLDSELHECLSPLSSKIIRFIDMYERAQDRGIVTGCHAHKYIDEALYENIKELYTELVKYITPSGTPQITYRECHVLNNTVVKCNDFLEFISNTRDLDYLLRRYIRVLDKILEQSYKVYVRYEGPPTITVPGRVNIEVEVSSECPEGGKACGIVFGDTIILPCGETKTEKYTIPTGTVSLEGNKLKVKLSDELYDIIQYEYYEDRYKPHIRIVFNTSKICAEASLGTKRYKCYPYHSYYIEIPSTDIPGKEFELKLVLYDKLVVAPLKLVHTRATYDIKRKVVFVTNTYELTKDVCAETMVLRDIVKGDGKVISLKIKERDKTYTAKYATDQDLVIINLGGTCLSKGTNIIVTIELEYKQLQEALDKIQQLLYKLDELIDKYLNLAKKFDKTGTKVSLSIRSYICMGTHYGTAYAYEADNICTHFANYSISFIAEKLYVLSDKLSRSIDALQEFLAMDEVPWGKLDIVLDAIDEGYIDETLHEAKVIKAYNMRVSTYFKKYKEILFKIDDELRAGTLTPESIQIESLKREYSDVVSYYDKVREALSSLYNYYYSKIKDKLALLKKLRGTNLSELSEKLDEIQKTESLEEKVVLLAKLYKKLESLGSELYIDAKEELLSKALNIIKEIDSVLRDPDIRKEIPKDVISLYEKAKEIVQKAKTLPYDEALKLLIQPSAELGQRDVLEALKYVQSYVEYAKGKVAYARKELLNRIEELEKTIDKLYAEKKLYEDLYKKLKKQLEDAKQILQKHPEKKEEAIKKIKEVHKTLANIMQRNVESTSSTTPYLLYVVLSVVAVGAGVLVYVLHKKGLLQMWKSREETEDIEYYEEDFEGL